MTEVGQARLSGIGVVRHILALMVLCWGGDIIAFEAEVLGGLEIEPSVGVGYFYSSNVLHQRENEIESPLIKISPELTVTAERDKGSLQLSGQVESGQYTNSEADDYVDTAVALVGNWKATRRNHFSLDTFVRQVHESRGLGFSQGAQALRLSEPDVFELTGLNTSYDFGASTAAGHLKFSYDFFARRAQTREDQLSLRDYRRNALATEFTVSVADSAKAITSVRYGDYEYFNLDSESERDLNNKEYALLIGAEKRFFRKVRGRLLVGWIEKNFESDLIEDFSGESVELGVDWAHKDYSKFSFMAQRALREPYAISNYIVATSANLKWQYDFGQHTSIRSFVGFENEEHLGGVVDREDSFYEFGVELRKRLWRSLEMRLVAESRINESSVSAFQYSADHVGIALAWDI